jgi:hypothetical protein
MENRQLADFWWFWQKNRTITVRAYCANTLNLALNSENNIKCEYLFR